MTKSSLPWWRSDLYEGDVLLPEVFEQYAGPKGVALVKAWPDGRTDQGWGLQGPKSDPSNGFMQRYPRGEFLARRVLFGAERDRWNFAIVMRSMRLVCIDIDGKNGGYDGALMLPKTMAETSKSGDGYHLFYSVDDTWTHDRGFGLLADRIGIEQGVDIRATGCVYHHKQQRWNDRPVAPMPAHLIDILQTRDRKVAESNARIIKTLANNDDLEVLMMHSQLIDDLEKPIDQGKRNNTLFAIGSQLCIAQVPGWEEKVEARAIDVGLDQDEVNKLLANIQRYGASQTP
jgi:hypothetical protein